MLYERHDTFFEVFVRYERHAMKQVCVKWGTTYNTNLHEKQTSGLHLVSITIIFVICRVCYGYKTALFSRCRLIYSLMSIQVTFNQIFTPLVRCSQPCWSIIGFEHQVPITADWMEVMFSKFSQCFLCILALLESTSKSQTAWPRVPQQMKEMACYWTLGQQNIYRI